MAVNRPAWLADLSRSFKRHRQGRPGWSVEVMRDRLRVVSAELPPRPDDPAAAVNKRRSVTLATPPGPATAAAALAEACGLFDQVITGTWRWPEPDEVSADELSPVVLRRLIALLYDVLVGEQIATGTWDRTYQPYLSKLVTMAAERHWPEAEPLLEAVLRTWEPGSRARQMAHDRLRRLWKEAGWNWPENLLKMRGNGKAAADPRGARAFTDDEIEQLRDLVENSRLRPSDLVAWDCLISFGLRPAELKGLELLDRDGQLCAVVTNEKKSSKGKGGARIVPAIPPGSWPVDCHGLLARWQENGLPSHVTNHRSPGEVMGQQLSRLKQVSSLDKNLVPYGCRHAFALRLGIDLSLSVREAAELMGHSPQVHLSTYGRRIDQPKLEAKVRLLLEKRKMEAIA